MEFNILFLRFSGFLRLCGVLLDMIKFEHTVFALPFAYIGALLAMGQPTGYSLKPFLAKLFWITLAMIGARTCGMGANRIVDRKLDGENPRTKDWAIPGGRLSISATRLIAYLAIGIFILSCWRLNELCLLLSPLAILLMVIYPYLKRFTWLSHLALGLILSCAPLGGWIAVKGEFSFEPLLLSMAVLFWVAGFDIIYSLLDLEFDKKAGLFSIPVSFGINKALKLSGLFHILTVAFLVSLGILLGLGLFFWCGVILFSIFLIYEHNIVKPYTLGRINEAFFVANGYASAVLGLFVLLDRWLIISLG